MAINLEIEDCWSASSASLAALVIVAAMVSALAAFSVIAGVWLLFCGRGAKYQTEAWQPLPGFPHEAEAAGRKRLEHRQAVRELSCG